MAELTAGKEQYVPANGFILGTTSVQFQAGEYGNFLNWSQNFFGGKMGDITEQAKETMKKDATEIGCALRTAIIQKLNHDRVFSKIIG